MQISVQKREFPKNKRFPGGTDFFFLERENSAVNSSSLSPFSSLLAQVEKGERGKGREGREGGLASCGGGVS